MLWPPLSSDTSASEPSSVATYTITVTNLGPSAANQTVVTDTLPADVTFNSYSASQGKQAHVNSKVRNRA